MKDILRPFIHCLYLFYARKNLHQNNTRQWESILTKVTETINAMVKFYFIQYNYKGNSNIIASDYVLKILLVRM